MKMLRLHIIRLGGVALLTIAMLLPLKGRTQNADATNKKDRPPNPYRAFDWTVPAAYRIQAIRLMLEEVNRVAKILSLPEDLPVTEKNAVEIILGPADVAQLVDAAGSVTTSNFMYTLTGQFRLEFLSPLKLDKPAERMELRHKYLWPIELADTNAAYQMAAQRLKALHVDVKGLERDCTVSVTFWRPDTTDLQRFVPLYWILWTSGPNKPMADVELLLATQSIRSLSSKPPYILPLTNAAAGPVHDVGPKEEAPHK